MEDLSVRLHYLLLFRNSYCHHPWRLHLEDYQKGVSIKL